jgi:exonuclease VII small subunit|tara:strand:+ start:184 stop:417 length:234 start_codon:yes stop_codon:yes gene_type:complete
MNSKNIPGDIKSKSIKEAKDEINVILAKLEKNDTDLETSISEYQRLIQLNKHVDYLFQQKVKDISNITKSIKSKKIK